MRAGVNGVKPTHGFMGWPRLMPYSVQRSRLRVPEMTARGQWRFLPPPLNPPGNERKWRTKGIVLYPVRINPAYQPWGIYHQRGWSNMDIKATGAWPYKMGPFMIDRLFHVTSNWGCFHFHVDSRATCSIWLWIPRSHIILYTSFYKESNMACTESTINVPRVLIHCISGFNPVIELTSFFFLLDGNNH